MDDLDLVTAGISAGPLMVSGPLSRRMTAVHLWTGHRPIRHIQNGVPKFSLTPVRHEQWRGQPVPTDLRFGGRPGTPSSPADIGKRAYVSRVRAEHRDRAGIRRTSPGGVVGLGNPHSKLTFPAALSTGIRGMDAPAVILIPRPPDEQRPGPGRQDREVSR